MILSVILIVMFILMVGLTTYTIIHEGCGKSYINYNPNYSDEEWIKKNILK